MKRIIIIIALLIGTASCQCDSSYNRIEFIDLQAQPVSCIAQGEVYVALSYAVDANSDRDSAYIWMNIQDANGNPVNQITHTLSTGGSGSTWDTFGVDVWAYTYTPNWLGWGWTTWGRYLRWTTLGVRLYAVTPGPWTIYAMDTTYGTNSLGLLDTCFHFDTLTIPACSVLAPAPVVYPSPEPVIERREYEYYEYGTMRRVLYPEPMQLYRKVDVANGKGIWSMMMD